MKNTNPEGAMAFAIIVKLSELEEWKQEFNRLARLDEQLIAHAEKLVGDKAKADTAALARANHLAMHRIEAIIQGIEDWLADNDPEWLKNI